MSVFVFDTCSLRELRSVYPQIFPTFWNKLDKLADDGLFRSVREVRREMDYQANNISAHVLSWAEKQAKHFHAPSADELDMVSEIFKVKHFRGLIKENDRLRGSPVADPHLIARAHVFGGCVVTQEKLKPHSNKIPNVCEHFKIDCVDLQGFLTKMNWKF